MTALEDIWDERKRQIEVEGWSADHDDRHEDAEMLCAAILYYHHAIRPADWPLKMRETGAPVGWPWSSEWWKPKDDKRRCLVIAGALCLAERDRIIRRDRRLHQGLELLGARCRSIPHTGHVDLKLKMVVEAITRIDATHTPDQH